MKIPTTRSLIRLVTVLAFAAIASTTQAQTVVEISNLAQANGGAITVNNTGTALLAQSFTTGSTATKLDFITPRFDTNLATAFTLSLYSNSTTNPGTLIETLTGTATPNSATTYNFTSGGTILAANTTYWWVASAATSTNQAYISFTNSASFTSPDGWTLGVIRSTTNSGTTWNDFNTGQELRFSVNASAVPEPSTYAALAGAAALGLAVWRRRRSAGVA